MDRVGGVGRKVSDGWMEGTREKDSNGGKASLNSILHTGRQLVYIESSQREV